MTPRWRFILLVSLIGNLTIVYVGYKAMEYRSHINDFLYKYLHVTDEFSQREVYVEANLPLRSDTIVPGRTVFLGTQVVENWPLAGSFPEYETINRGVTGQRAPGLLFRFRPDVVELGPEAVVIEISSYNFRPHTNPREMFDYVVSMAELAEYNDIKPVVTTVIPPRSDFELEEFPNYSVKDTVAVYSARLRAIAIDRGWTVADLAAVVINDNGYLDSAFSASRVDLNQRGYDLVSEEVRRSLATTE